MEEMLRTDLDELKGTWLPDRLDPMGTREFVTTGAGFKVLRWIARRFVMSSEKAQIVELLIEVDPDDGPVVRTFTIASESQHPRPVPDEVISEGLRGALVGVSVLTHRGVTISAKATGDDLTADEELFARRRNLRRATRERLERVGVLLGNGGDVHGVIQSEHVSRPRAYALIAQAKELQFVHEGMN